MENRIRILERLKDTKTIRAAILGMFAVLLTAGAITGQDKAGAALSNTGAPGSVTVSSVKKFGGDYQSDYQGEYFYILPCTGGTNDVTTYYTGTMFRTGKKDSKNNWITYRDYFLSEDLSTDNVSWSNQYIYTRIAGLTTVPAQTSKALMFVPYNTYNGTSLKSGWKANESAVCYYDVAGNSVKNRYHVTQKTKYLNNRIFAPDYDKNQFGDYCRDGVYYHKLAVLTADRDGKLKEEDIEIDGIRKKLSTPSGIKKFVASDKSLQTKGYNLWCYILSLDKNNNTLSFNASDKLTKFLKDGYNSSIRDRNSAYSSSNPTGIGLTSGLKGKYRMSAWTDGDVNSDVFKNNRFAQREYNLHVLDLMLCAYAASVKQQASSEVQRAWLRAISDYITVSGSYEFGYDGDIGHTITSAFPIAICGGVIARGQTRPKTGIPRTVSSTWGHRILSILQSSLKMPGIRKTRWTPRILKPTAGVSQNLFWDRDLEARKPIASS